MADACAKPEIAVRGATNLPEGSIVNLSVADAERDASGKRQRHSDLFYTEVDRDGFFQCHLTAEPGATARELLVAVMFVPSADQPREVLAAVGSKGEKLGPGGYSQVGIDLNGHRYLGELASVDSCEEKKDGINRICKLCRQFTEQQKALLGAVVYTQRVGAASRFIKLLRQRSSTEQRAETSNG